MGGGRVYRYWGRRHVLNLPLLRGRKYVSWIPATFFLVFFLEWERIVWTGGSAGCGRGEKGIKFGRMIRGGVRISPERRLIIRRMLRLSDQQRCESLSVWRETAEVSLNRKDSPKLKDNWPTDVRIRGIGRFGRIASRRVRPWRSVGSELEVRDGRVMSEKMVRTGKGEESETRQTWMKSKTWKDCKLWKDS